jgi:ABC-2 type transport system permease protein
MLFTKLIHVSLHSQLQYRASFFTLMISHFLTTFADIVGLWALFDRFKMIQGWTLPELCLIYGIVHMGFALAECFARGFDTFSHMIKSGEFDRLLLRPLSTLFQIATSDVQFMRFGRFLQGLVVLLWGAYELRFSLFSLHALVILFSVLGTWSLFYGLFIVQATLSFWLVESLEIMNIATYGSVQAGQFPMSIYVKPFRMIFTFLIPLACVAYYPIATLLRQTSIPIWLGLAAPFAGLLFLFCACQFWHLGVRHYRSTGS